MPERWSRLVVELWRVRYRCTPYEVKLLANLQEKQPPVVSPKVQRILLEMQAERLERKENADFNTQLRHVKVRKTDSGPGHRITINDKEVGHGLNKKNALTIALWLDSAYVEIKNMLHSEEKRP